MWSGCSITLAQFESTARLMARQEMAWSKARLDGSSEALFPGQPVSEHVVQLLH